MIAPALIFLSFNASHPGIRNGWAIPTATDIAFALGILALLGSRVPPVLKVFLMALAVIDDLGAIVIIALFYSSHIAWGAMALVVAAVAVLALMNRAKVSSPVPYLLVGAVLWVAVLLSGIHATIAGVILGLMMPVKGTGYRGCTALNAYPGTLDPLAGIAVICIRQCRGGCW